MMVERSWVPDDCGTVSGLDLFNPFNEIHTDSTSKQIHTHTSMNTHTHTHTHTIIAITLSKPEQPTFLCGDVLD